MLKIYDTFILSLLKNHDKSLFKAIYNHYNKGDCIGYIKNDVYFVEYAYNSGAITYKQAIKICNILNRFYDFNIKRVYYKDIYVNIERK